MEHIQPAPSALGRKTRVALRMLSVLAVTSSLALGLAYAVSVVIDASWSSTAARVTAAVVGIVTGFASYHWVWAPLDERRP